MTSRMIMFHGWLRVGVLVICAAVHVSAANKDFDGPLNGDWDTGANWDADGVPGVGDNVFVFVNGGATKTISLANTPTPNIVNESVLAREGNGTATVNHSGGTLTVNSWFNLAQGFGAQPNDGTGIWNMSGTAVLNLTHSAGGVTVLGAGFADAPSGFNTGTLTITDTAQFLQTAADIRLAGELSNSRANGSIDVSGNGVLSTDNNIIVGVCGSGEAIISLSNSASLSANWMLFANGSDSVGVLYNRDSASLSVTGGADKDYFPLGNAVNAYGYYLHDSTVPVTLKEVGVGGHAGGNGILEVASGTLTVDTWLTICRGNLAGGQSGMVLVQGGTLQTQNGVQFRHGWGANGNQYGLIDVGAGGTINGLGAASAMNINGQNIDSNVGLLTVHGGGVVELSNVYADSAAATSVVNFANGTFKAKAAVDIFGANLDGIYLHDGGLTIDSAGLDFTIDNALLAPTGDGVQSIGLTANGSGYVGRPIVRIAAGGGLGATAVAEWNDATGEIDSITVTSPGSGYTSSPTVTLVGGGGTGATVGAVTLGTAVSGGLTKTGLGTLALTGASTYTGDTRVVNGTLALNNANAIAYSALDWNVADSGTLTLGQSPTTVGALKGGRDLNCGANGFALGYADGTYSGNLTGGAFLAKYGTGTQTFDGTLNLNFWVNFDQGVVNLVSPFVGTVAHDFNVGDGAASRVAMNIGTGASLTCNTLLVGKNGSAVAVVNQTGGTVQKGAAGGDWRFGQAAGTYGAYILSDGALNTGNSNFQIGAWGRGMLRQTGGTVTCGTWPAVGRYNGCEGIYTITGGIFNQTGGGNDLIIAEEGIGTLNVGGTGAVNLTGDLRITISGTGTVNLNGGTVTMVSVFDGGGDSTLNFNGGTLRPSTANGTFCQGLDRAYVYAGGAVIDANGNNVTIAQPLLAATGYGVTGITASTLGADYLAPPLVTLSGGSGTGAKAIANVSGGQVTGFTVTCLGTGYAFGDTLTVTLAGGGATTPASGFNVTLGANGDGGLTKNGLGTLSLAGANTYEGETVINAGTLSVDNPQALPSNGVVRIVSGAFLNLNRSIRVSTLYVDGVEQPAGGYSSGNLANITGGGVLAVGELSGLVHRWSFSNDLTDSVGGSDATIEEVGANDVTLSATQVTLSGGAKAASDFVRLGANLLPDTEDAITLEFWATQITVQNWSRIFDFGFDLNEYMMMSWTRGTVLNEDRVSWRDNGAAESNVSDSNAPYTLGVEHHIVLVIEPGAGAGGTMKLTWYSARGSDSDLGIAKGTLDTAFTLSGMNDVEDNLGRSFYGDNTANASYNEARIWLGAKSAAELEMYHDLGPDDLTPPAGTLFLMR
jgi:autotransporter-associated beta strand protein